MLDKPQIIIHVEKTFNHSIFDVCWIPCSAKFVVIGSYPKGSGSVHIYEMSKGDVSLIKECEKGKAFKCGTFGASQLANRHLATGDFSGTLQVWDIDNLENPVYAAKAHQEIINAIDGVGGLGIGYGAPEIVTGSRDGMLLCNRAKNYKFKGSVKIWDIRQKQRPVALFAPEEGSMHRDCWTVAFGNSFNQEERYVAAGYDNGDFKLYDLKNMKVQWETNIQNGICCVQFDRKDIPMNKLVVTCLEAKFLTFDLRTQHPSRGFPCHITKVQSSTIWKCSHLPQNRDIFLTSSGNGSIYLWKYNYPPQRVKKDSDGYDMGVAGTLTELQHVTLCTQPVTAASWNPDKLGLCVCTSLDQTARVILVTKLNTI